MNLPVILGYYSSDLGQRFFQVTEMVIQLIEKMFKIVRSKFHAAYQRNVKAYSFRKRVVSFEVGNTV